MADEPIGRRNGQREQNKEQRSFLPALAIEM